MRSAPAPIEFERRLAFAGAELLFAVEIAEGMHHAFEPAAVTGSQR